MKVLQDKVAVITGAGRGIGRAIALAYAAEGAKVVVASRTPSTVDEVVGEITRTGGTAIGVPCDVGERDQVFGLIDTAARTYGTVDILVNNAHGFGTADNPQPSTTYVAFEDTNEAEWDYQFRTSATATLWAMKAVFPHMKPKGGKIINLGSSSGQMGFEGNACYNASKEAIRALVRTAAREWGQYNINVNALNPSVATRAFEAWSEARPEFVDAMIQRIPLKRLGDPLKDLAPVAVFLASGASDYVTGMTVMVEGGMHIFP